VPHISKILIFPIKSLDGIEVDQIEVLASGSLLYDREFAIIDEQGRFVNGKRHAKIHLLRSQFDLSARTISLKLPDNDSFKIFHLDQEKKALAETLSNFFGFSVTIIQNTEMGFPDDTKSPGPTLVSEATLQEVASWYDDVSIEQMRYRIRANIEISGVPAFWEDKLFGESGKIVSFLMGDVSFLGINPCQRCIVPTRDSLTAKPYPNFQKIFTQKRKETLPNWAASSRFSHFYRLAVNTQLPNTEKGKTLCIGNPVEIRD
jgi:uncharacterized protein